MWYYVVWAINSKDRCSSTIRRKRAFDSACLNSKGYDGLALNLKTILRNNDEKLTKAEFEKVESKI